MLTGRRRRLPWVLAPGAAPHFPDPRLENGLDGLVAIGGDLSVDRLLSAYRCGIFPWFSEDSEVLWWSPNPRAIIEMDAVHVSRSLRRRLNRNEFEFSMDRAFREVMLGCADRPKGTWILPSMIDAYCRLHASGFAHSFEVWLDSELVGGLYGVAIGRAFAAESMWSRVTDASKAGLVTAILSLRRLGVTLFDVQFVTRHLESLGARAIARDEYLTRLSAAQDHPLDYSRIELNSRELGPRDPQPEP